MKGIKVKRKGKMRFGASRTTENKDEEEKGKKANWGGWSVSFFTWPKERNCGCLQAPGGCSSSASHPLTCPYPFLFLTKLQVHTQTVIHLIHTYTSVAPVSHVRMLTPHFWELPISPIPWSGCSLHTKVERTLCRGEGLCPNLSLFPLSASRTDDVTEYPLTGL